jgi:thioester reductase-like protein
VTALARSSNGHSARVRVEDALGLVAAVQDRDGEAMGRLDVVEGDLAQPGLGLSDASMAQIRDTTGEIWHSGASLSFRDEDRHGVFRVNLEGTRTVLELAHAIPGGRLHHVSTAYIAGERTGPARETENVVGQRYRSVYEESKSQSELLVERAAGDDDLRATIYRPSIVIGDSSDGRVGHFHGVYGFIRALWRAARKRQERSGAGTVSLSLRIRGAEESTLNFVPVDYVVDAMMTIGRQPSSEGGTFHVTNPHATPNRLWFDTVCRLIGIEGVRLVNPAQLPEREMTRLEAIFHKQMAFYVQYLASEPRFSRDATDQALAGSAASCPEPTPEFVERMVGWYVDFLDSSASASGEAASDRLATPG